MCVWHVDNNKITDSAPTASTCGTGEGAARDRPSARRRPAGCIFGDKARRARPGAARGARGVQVGGVRTGCVSDGNLLFDAASSSADTSTFAWPSSSPCDTTVSLDMSVDMQSGCLRPRLAHAPTPNLASRDPDSLACTAVPTENDDRCERVPAVALTLPPRAAATMD